MEQPRNPASPDCGAALAALLAFDPVPVRRRRDGWTPERQQRYVLALFETGHGGKAARAVGMTEQGAAKLRRRPTPPPSPAPARPLMARRGGVGRRRGSPR